jgi:hypothetical protein
MTKQVFVSSLKTEYREKRDVLGGEASEEAVGSADGFYWGSGSFAGSGSYHG